MGVKRTSREENITELSFKQPKQFDNSIQTATYMTTDLPSDVLRIDGAGEPNSNSCDIQINGTLESGETLCVSTAENESERTSDIVENILQSEQHKQLSNNIKLYSSGSFSSTTSSDEEEEDSETEDFSSAHTFPGYTDISKPSRMPHQYLDPYVSSLNSSPRKEIPVGPNHQVDIPNWEPHVYRQNFPAPGESFLGMCVVPMPYSHIMGLVENVAGLGRTDCLCRDVGSTRCVRQHVREARQRLCESLSHTDFHYLGIFGMGEEVVACHWSDDEQRLFRDVVVTSPLSLGHKFWETLSVVFSNRTEQDILRYYFNVFMLRRRAFQNRSCTLAADSDDDETPYEDDDDGKGSGDGCGDDGTILAYNDNFYSVDEEDEDEEEEWTDDRDLDVGCTRGLRPRPGDFGGEEGGRDRWDNFGFGGGKGEGF